MFRSIYPRWTISLFITRHQSKLTDYQYLSFDFNNGFIHFSIFIVEDSKITKIVEGNTIPNASFDEVIEASGCFVLPGLIDDHVHFREPGLERKADIESESRAAVYGGVTSFFDMPNTNPQTTTVEALDDKYRRAAKESHINYSFFYGATNDNVDDFAKLDVHHIPGIKLFMGASTGNMLVDRQESLEMIFRRCADMNLPLMTHCEDTNLINENMAKIKAEYGDDPDVKFHPVIRDEKVCWNSSSLAVELAKKYGTRLHLAHVTTAKELSLFVPSVFVTFSCLKIPTGATFPSPSMNPFSSPSCIASARIAITYLSTYSKAKSAIAFGSTM